MYSSIFNSFPVIRTASAKIAIFTYHSPHFCFPWRRPYNYHAICCMDGKTIQCLPNPLQHVPILHSLICRVLLLLLLLLRNASDLRNCTLYFRACMWVWYGRPPIGAHFHPTPQPPTVPQQLGEKDGSPLRGVARLCRGRRPPLGDRTRLVYLQ